MINIPDTVRMHPEKYNLLLKGLNRI